MADLFPGALISWIGVARAMGLDQRVVDSVRTRWDELRKDPNQALEAAQLGEPILAWETNVLLWLDLRLTEEGDTQIACILVMPPPELARFDAAPRPD